MPRLEVAAEGNKPRTVSNALALRAWRWAKSLSPAALGWRSREPVVKHRQQLPVRIEHAVHVPHVPGAQGRRQYFGAAVIAVPPARQTGVVGDVTGRLFHVGHEPASFEHLCEQVGRLFAGEVDPAELGDRIVAVLEENPIVELLGPGQAYRGIDAVVAAHVQVAHELVQEQPAQALGRAGITGEQRPLYDFGQVDEREDRSLEVREVAAEDVRLLGGPSLLGVRDVDRRSELMRGASLRGGLAPVGDAQPPSGPRRQAPTKAMARPSGPGDGAVLTGGSTRSGAVHHRRRRHHSSEQHVGRLAGHLGRALVGQDLAQLAQEVDELLDVADEVPGRDDRAPQVRPDLGRRQQFAQLLAPGPAVGQGGEARRRAPWSRAGPRLLVCRQLPGHGLNGVPPLLGPPRGPLGGPGAPPATALGPRR